MGSRSVPGSDLPWLVVYEPHDCVLARFRLERHAIAFADLYKDHGLVVTWYRKDNKWREK